MYKNACALLPYRNAVIRSAVWQLKYYDDARIAHIFGTLLKEALLSHIKTPHLLVPIPLSARRLRERGYNQATRIATHAVAGLEHIVLAEHVLVREKHFSSQTKLHRKERLENLAGAFIVTDREALVGKDILLLDDVVTTGATMGDARRALLEGGARTVTMVALAH